MKRKKNELKACVSFTTSVNDDDNENSDLEDEETMKEAYERIQKTFKKLYDESFFLDKNHNKPK